MTHHQVTNLKPNWRLNALVGVLALAGCASEAPLIPAPLTYARSTGAGPKDVVPDGADRSRQGIQVIETPKPPVGKSANYKAPAAPVVAGDEKADITLSFEQIPLPTFIQVVYGSILKKNFSIDPQIATRQDLVTLRTGAPQTPSAVLATARSLLESYGVAVNDVGGFYRIVPNNSTTGYSPEIRRGRAMPDVPQAVRPIYQLVELQAVKPADVGNWIRPMFNGRVQVQDDQLRNALLLSGQSNDVQAAVDAIQVLDQPALRGRQSVKLVPAFWSADELAKRLSEVLSAEGYASATVLNPFGNNPPVILLPIQAINTVIVFAADKTVMDHVTTWARDLDKPSRGGAGNGYFTYQVKFADADALAQTLQTLISGAAPVATTAAPGAAPTAAPKSARVVVNKPTNSLIFQGNAEEYTQWIGLLQDLDRPVKSALIEVTVAEVTLDSSLKLGVEWALADITRNGNTYSLGSKTGAQRTGGLVWTKTLMNGTSPIDVISALATDNRVKVLSSPRIVARNGQQATIEVGDDVPIITSNQTGVSTTGGTLQTIQYRSTGVILKVKPVIQAGGRVELEVSQEVSSAASTTTGVDISPTISKRRIDTQLSLRDGMSVMLGGLISQNDNNTDNGVPWLKDIPIAGQLFSNTTKEKKKTELIVMITPYVINDDFEAEALSEAFRERLGAWAKEDLQGRPKSGVVASAQPPLSAVKALTPTEPEAAGAFRAVSPSAPSSVAPSSGQESLPDAPVPVSPPPAENLPTAPAPSLSPAAPVGQSGGAVTDPKILKEVQEALGRAGKPAGK